MTARKRSVKANSGSPSPGEPEYLVVGILRRPHGLKGEMLMEVITDFPERLKAGTTVYLGDQHKPGVIEASRGHARGMLVRLQGLASPEMTYAFRNQFVYVLTADRPPLPEGQYYHHQLLGSTVMDESGQLLGMLTEIIQTGANDVYVIGGAGKRELLLPATAEVVQEIDLNRHLLRIRVPEGIEASPKLEPSRRRIRAARPPKGPRPSDGR